MVKMLRHANVLLALLLLAAGGVHAENVRPPLDYKGTSRLLEDALRQAIVAVLKHDETKPPPLQLGKSETDAIEDVLKQYRTEGVLRVTRSEEAQFKSGVFDDKINRDCLETQLEVLEDYGSNVTVLSAHFIRKFNAGELQGMQLELAVRVVQYDITRVKVERKRAEDKAKRQPKETAKPQPAEK